MKNDLISREETLKAFSDYVGSGMSMNDFDALWDIVAKMPPVKETKWICVSNGLPEERDWYLAVFKEKDSDYQLIPRVADYIGENNWRIIDEDGLGCKEYRDILECVAWMPLPEPYKAESEDN